MLNWFIKSRVFVQSFFSRDTGAISVDWVVLTAGIVTVVALGLLTISGSLEELANWVAEQLKATEIVSKSSQST